MYLSKLFHSTSKEEPKESSIISHSLLTRAGFIHQVSAGIYNFTPLGLKIISKIENIVRKQLNAKNAQEVKLGFVTPIELWEESGRANKYGKELLKFKDRKNNSFVLGPTHEEMMVNLVRSRISSYKQLPLNLYQINTKFRDEARPRFGTLRAREFIMKDGYSFHADTQDMKREFLAMQDAYSKVFEELGLDFRVVEADSGAIGGSGSKEFMVLADNGEDDIVVCTSCEYAANVESAARKASYEEQTQGAFSYFYTPEQKMIEAVCSYLHTPKETSLKAVVKKATYDDREQVVVFFVRGSEELQEIKALNACGANELVTATVEDLEAHGLIAGFIGPVELEDVNFADDAMLDNRTLDTAFKAKKILDLPLYFDQELQGSGQYFVCGANKKDYHFVGLDLSEFELTYCDLITVTKGDICSICGAPLDIKRGIEVGHIFQLGTKYSAPLKATFLDNNGKAKPFEMGTYGIGVSRLLSASLEQRHDERGCIWHKSIAPFSVCVIMANAKDEIIKQEAIKLYDELKAQNIDALLDDRNERFGFKMNDFELIGYPYGVIVGKSVSEGKVEFVTREGLQKEEMPLSSIVATVQKALA